MTAQATLAVPTAPVEAPPLEGALGALWRNKSACVGAVYLLVLLVVAVVGPWLVPASATESALLDRLEPPVWVDGGSWAHVLGTDAIGRDMLSRLVVGARVTLIVSISVVVLAAAIGTLLGLVAGYKGGGWDTLIMRAADAQLAFPGLLLVLLVLAVIGTNLLAMIGILTLYGWMIYARLVRSIVLELRQSPAVAGAELVGCSTARILRRHLLPALYAALLTQGMLELARVALVEAGLSYLGLGIQPPDVSWGLMIAENQAYIQVGWWTVLFPGLALALTVIAINLVANWLRVQGDPQQRQRRFAASGRVRRADRRRAEDVWRVREAPPTAAATTGTAPLLEVDGLEVHFHTVEGRFAAVRNASFAVRAGETLGIVGESGSGKTTVALALMDLVPPPGRIEGGRIRWRGEALTPSDLRRLRGTEIAMIFQDPMTSLNPLVRVGRQITEVLVKHRGMSRADARRRAEELLELVGVPSARQRLSQLPHELSGGLRQRVMIAAALAAEPRLLIADEPTTALDTTVQSQILDLIAELQRSLGVAFLIITHDLGVVARVCDRVVVMYGGHVVEDGRAEQLFATPAHPYTRALMETVPRIGQVRGRLATIPGHPPGKLELISGCAFAPRCARATDDCGEMPLLATHGAPNSQRRLACWHPLEED